jgi:hypothetical protein
MFRLLFILIIPTVTATPTFEAAHALLEEYCHRCHNEKKHKGDLNLERFDTEAKVFAHYRVWLQVLEQVEAGDMPPEDKDQQRHRRRPGAGRAAPFDQRRV